MTTRYIPSSRVRGVKLADDIWLDIYEGKMDYEVAFTITTDFYIGISANGYDDIIQKLNSLDYTSELLHNIAELGVKPHEIEINAIQ